MGNKVVEICCNTFEPHEAIGAEHKIVKVSKQPEMVIE